MNCKGTRGVNDIVSVVIGSYNHAALLRRTLQSIVNQLLPVEIIVADDASTDDTPKILADFPVTALNTGDWGHAYHNGVRAKNLALRHAHGDIVIQQSDDVVHAQPDLVERLVEAMRPGMFATCTVYEYDFACGTMGKQYVGHQNRRPLLFLGATWREDVCKVGGYDSDFAELLWWDDNRMADGLMKGLGLKCEYLPLLGLHQAHSRPDYQWQDSKALYERKTAAQDWFAPGAPWPFVPGKAVCDVE